MRALRYSIILACISFLLSSCLQQRHCADTPEELAHFVINALQQEDEKGFMKLGYTSHDDITCIQNSKLPAEDKKERVETVNIGKKHYDEFLHESWSKNFSEIAKATSWPSITIKRIQLGEHGDFDGITERYKKIYVHLDNDKVLEIEMVVLTERGWLIQRSSPLSLR